VEADRPEEADHERVVGWYLAAMIEEDVEAAEKLWTELVKERAHLDAECTADEVEEDAAWCQEAIGSVLDATAEKRRICAKSKWWGNADIKERRKEVGREKMRRWTREEGRGRKQNSRSRFDTPRVQCGGTTCKV